METMTETSKVPEITVGFWIIKIFATTLGEVGGNAVTMQLGFGYLIGSGVVVHVLVFVVGGTIGLWYWTLGSVAVQTVVSPKVEAFYWTTIMFSQTLGTALGDWMADTGLGYNDSALGGLSEIRPLRKKNRI